MLINLLVNDSEISKIKGFVAEYVQWNRQIIISCI